jgi:hypothetical protein
MAFDLPSEGTRRLRVIAGIASVVVTVVIEWSVLFLHGIPYRTFWWFVLGAILIGSFFAGRALVTLIEWVIAGYRADPRPLDQRR